MCEAKSLEFLKFYLVVEACARIFPPMGFLGSAWNERDAPGSAVTWLVIKTATLYSSEIFCSLDIICNERRKN